MFCSKCGVKLPQKSNKCPNCGAPAPADEYCGGFWGLVKGQKPDMNGKEAGIDDNYRKNEISKGENKPSEREIKAINRYKKNIKMLLIISAALAVIVVVELIFIVALAVGSGGAEQTEPTANIVTSENETEKIGGEIGEEIGGYKFSADAVYNETTENLNQFEETGENPYQAIQDYTAEETTEWENNGNFQNDKKEEFNPQF